MTNTYLQYKQDQKRLVYWLIHASNTIIKSFPAETTIPLNTSGEITLSSLVSLSELVAKHIKPIPATIHRLLRSVIEARKKTHSLFRRLVAEDPDPEVVKSNISHEVWINGLTKAFNLMGGEAWLTKIKDSTQPLGEENEDEVVFSNKFAGLNLSEADDEEDEQATERATNAPVRVQSKGKKKGKGKKGRQSKGENVDESDLDKVPFESYRIIEDQTGLVTDYLLSCYSLNLEWSDLRSCMQGVWYRVAYHGLNSAVAGALRNISLGMFSKIQTETLADFPGHESYETIMKTITRGDPDKAQGSFRLSMSQWREDNTGPVETLFTRDVEIREHLMIYAYQDLLDFVTDFQKTRSGKPTRAMLKTLNWDPTLDLSQASNEDRLKWRRAYTINWLYDLVNVFSAIVTQRRNLGGEKIQLESVDWSVHGPWHHHRRLYGLNEFAGEVTALAMQKPATDIKPKIQPHLVFQLQCIIDSLCVSRGWLANGLYGDTLICPPKTFRPRRDLDLFLDRMYDREPRGFIMEAARISIYLEQYVMVHGGPIGYMYGLKTIPPSRFTSTNSNGLWEYSPYLCGVGLMEALELAHAVSMRLWESSADCMCLMHLHNMLVQKRYLKSPIGLYKSLELVFRDDFFVDGKVPKSHFVQALLAVVFKVRNLRTSATYRNNAYRDYRNASDLRELLVVSTNPLLRSKSLVTLYREAYWIPDRIPDSDIPTATALASLRLHQVKRVVDPVTGKGTLEDTELVRRFRAAGWDDPTMLALTETSTIVITSVEEDKMPKAVLEAHVAEGYKWQPKKSTQSHTLRDKGILSSKDFLRILEFDLKGDIGFGSRPIWV
ncbi:hypothetical protein BJY04DRAFT_222810 [Aspergillus karnatakaensis]|uniref:uncharacterized protein n=1 Tax=Aspergillus karnatakaensis TaxID=1810916 RepID=UPI003CCC94B0